MRTQAETTEAVTDMAPLTPRPKFSVAAAAAMLTGRRNEHEGASGFARLTL
jgi:hypothetical protein